MSAISLLALVGLGSSVWRRAKASSRCVSAAAREAAPWAARDVALEIADPALRQPRLQQLETAADPGQQIVEIVRQAAGELTHGLHLLRLEQLLARLLQLHLGFAPLGEIAGDLGEADKLAVVVDGIDHHARPRSGCHPSARRQPSAS